MTKNMAANAAAIDALFTFLIGTENRSQAARINFLSNDPQAQQVLHEVRRILSAWPYALEAQSAPQELKARVLAAVAKESSKARHEPASESMRHEAPVYDPRVALFIQRAHEGAWVHPGVPGVAVKTLFVDHETGYETVLVRMERGARFPTHRHAGYEECYVLQGDVRSGEVELSAGDYQRMAGGTLHEALSTNNGCLLLIVTSEHNEFAMP